MLRTHAIVVATLIAFISIGSGIFLFQSGGREIYISANASTTPPLGETTTTLANIGAQEAPAETSTPKQATPGSKDIENQQPLPNPPGVIKAVYATSWTAGTPSRIARLIDLIKRTELNAIVIDIKDYSGHVLYNIQNEDVARYGAREIRISRINTLLKQLHDAGIYVIARQTIFQDPILAAARPDLALHNGAGAATSTPLLETPLWKDAKGLAWIDPAAKDAWDYNIAIAKDAVARGFDEINFDYVRFASDGSLHAIRFPFYNPETTLKKTTIKNFFAYVREHMGETVLFADLFGLTTINNDDLGIGQSLEVAAEYFDFLAPMTYPSHYADGFIGFKNPAEHPYEVIQYSLEKADGRLLAASLGGVASGTTSSIALPQPAAMKYRAKLRPWIQDFDLGANYDASKVRAEIQAIDDTTGKTPLFNGWMIWDPKNIYTEGALKVE
jgi:hypothetical protein